MDALRRHLLRALDWGDAHADAATILSGMPPDLQGVRPEGALHSAWELLDHLRRTQLDILDFCLNADYEPRAWPADYWPERPEPPSPDAWDEAAAAFRRDLERMKDLVRDPACDLFAEIPHGQGQTYLREVLLVIDHNSHHLGQLILVRRLRGAWPG